MKISLKKSWLNNSLKTRILLIVGFLFFYNSLYLKAQINLVPNPSFEILDTCPYFGSQLYFAKPWYAPQNNSTDLFNKCSNANSYGGVPCLLNGNCNYSYQYAKDGVGYAGIFVLNGNNYREYLQVNLKNNLLMGHCYKVQYYVNLSNVCRYSSNGIGAYFSIKMDTQMIWWNGITPTILHYQPQIMKKGNPIITDTLNWTPISGIYVSNGTESYLTIGCFTTDSLIDTLNVNPTGYGGAYYFIDDVSVIEATPQNMQYELALHDSTITEGSAIKIGEDEITGVQYAWYVNNNFMDTTGIITIHPTTQTTYVRQMSWCGYSWYDTVTVSVSTGIEQLMYNNEQIILYPNPVAHQLTVSSKQFTVNTIEVTNLLGQKISIDRLRMTGHGELVEPYQLSTENLPSGIYFLKATDTKGNTRNAKFIKE